jgi:hypothetical protein
MEYETDGDLNRHRGIKNFLFFIFSGEDLGMVHVINFLSREKIHSHPTPAPPS